MHSTFTSWDADRSGGLSVSEFSRISQGTMSELFISRVFQEHVTRHRQPMESRGTCSGGGSAHGMSRRATEGGSADVAAAHEATNGQQGPGGQAAPGAAQDAMGAGAGQANTSSSSGADTDRKNSVGGCSGGCSGEMDMMAFVDFVLAWDHRNHAAALPYFFTIFDIHKQVGLGFI